jgi:hypothetical protein
VNGWDSSGLKRDRRDERESCSPFKSAVAIDRPISMLDAPTVVMRGYNTLRIMMIASMRWTLFFVDHWTPLQIGGEPCNPKLVRKVLRVEQMNCD